MLLIRVRMLDAYAGTRADHQKHGEKDAQDYYYWYTAANEKWGIGRMGALGDSVFIRGTLIFPANANLSSK